MRARICAWTVACALGAAALASPAGENTSAMAGPDRRRTAALVLEVHTGNRPVGAARALAPALRELAGAGLATGARAARLIESRVSRPAAPDAQPPAGLLLARASADLRRGRASDAERTMSELVRRFPEAAPSRSEHGGDAVELYRRVRRRVERAGSGRLIVEASDPDAVIFVDDVFRGVGRVSESVAAGSHEVHVQIGKQPGRVREVMVVAGAATRVRVQWELDRALRTGTDWAGLIIERRRSSSIQAVAAGAAAIARAAGVRQVVLLAIEESAGDDAERVLVGAMIDAATGRVVRRASAPLAAGDARIARIARVLAGAPPQATPEPPRRWLKWWLAASSLVAMGAGATLIHLDGRCQEHVAGRPCPVTLQTGPYGWAALGVGLGLGGASAYYFWREGRHPEARGEVRLSVRPGVGGANVTLGFDF